MTIAIVGSLLTDENQTTTTATVSKTWTAGNSIVALCVWIGDNDLTSIVLGGSQTLTATRARVYRADSNVSIQIYYLNSISSSGAADLVLTKSVGGTRGLYAVELSGTSTTGVFDVDNTASAASGTPSLSLTTSGNNAAVFAIAVNGDDFGSGDYSASGSGYVTVTMANPNSYADGEYNLDVGAAGSKTVAMSAFSAEWSMLAAAFNALTGNSLVVDSGTLSLAPQGVSLLAAGNFVLPVDVVTSSFQGQDVLFLYGVPWTESTLTLTGQSVSLVAGVSFSLAVDVGSASFAGQTINFILDEDFTVPVTNASLSLAGQSITLSALTSFVLAVDTSTASFVGQNVDMFTPYSTASGASGGRRCRDRAIPRLITGR
jgi:hypothetical protein